MSPIGTSGPVVILLVEDNPGDVRLTREALREADWDHTLHVAEDGSEALDFLHRRGAYTQAPKPGLVLLDLNLPGLNGLEVLAHMKADPQLCTIPVQVLSSSAADDDIAASYRLHANAYVSKPNDPASLVAVFSAMKRWWQLTVTLPTGSRHGRP